ncbi:Zinc finger, CCHC-type [Sesbania bispinosa]|nr:Zinc finger, CCHC-type [Sesbania bispinosa]
MTMAEDEEKGNSRSGVQMVSMTDPTSPYYLTAGDNLGVIVTPVQLKGDNYEEWAKALRNAFKAKKKLGFVDGKIPKLADNSSALEDWEAMNAMLAGWILNTIDPSLRSSLSYLENTVASYYGKLKTMWEELNSYVKNPVCSCSGCSCGATKELAIERDKEKVHQFLMGLDDGVSGTIRSSILSMPPLPNVNRVYAMIVIEETHKVVARMKGKHACSKCGKLGHEINDCFQIIGYPDWWQSDKNGRGTGRRNRGVRGRHLGRGRGAQTANAAQQFGHGTTSTQPGGVAEKQGSFPGLNNDQWSTLLDILNSHKATYPTRNSLVSKCKILGCWIQELQIT